MHIFDRVFLKNFDKKLIRFSAFSIIILELVGTYLAYFFNVYENIIKIVNVLFFILFTSVLIFLFRWYTKERDIKKFVKNLFFNCFNVEHLLLFFSLGLLILSYLVDGFSLKHSIHPRGVIFHTIISVTVFFSCGRYLAIKKHNYFFEWFIDIFCVGITLMMFVITVKLYLQIPICTPSGGDIFMDGNRLRINSNPNTVGAYSALCSMICIFMAIWKSGVLRIFYCFASVIHFVILALSNSRGALVGFVCATGIMFGLYFFYKFYKYPQKRRIVYSIAFTIIVIVFIYVTRKIVIFSYEKVRDWVLGGIDSPTVDRDLELTSLSGRGEIWIYALKAMLADVKTALFGVTPGNVENAIDAISEGKYVMYTHNQILEVGLATGIPSMILFVIWLFIMAKDCMMIVFAKDNLLDIRYRLLPFLVLYLVISNMVEAIIMFQGRFPECIFMLLCGWCSEKKRINNKQLYR